MLIIFVGHLIFGDEELQNADADATKYFYQVFPGVILG